MIKKLFALLFLVALLQLVSFAQKPKKPILANTKAVASSKPTPGSEKEALEKALALSDLAKRIAALQKFVANFPKSAEKTRALEIIVSTRAQLGEEKLRLSETESGVEFFKQAIKDAPSPLSDKLFSEVVLQFPTNLFYRGQQAAAIEVAKLIEEKTGDNAKQLLALATFYLGTENAGEARRIAEKVIALDAKLPPAYQTLGFANRLNFQLEDSANAYARALEIDPNSVVSKRSLAEMKRAIGKTDEAVALYRELLEKNAEDTAAQTGFVLSLFDAEKLPEAEAVLNKVLEKNPGNLVLLVGVAYWYAAHRDAAKAIDFARRAVAIEPRYTWAHIALARGLLLENKPLEAEKQLLLARQFGNFPTLDYEIASALLAAGFYEEAARELKKNFVIKDDLIETRLGNRVTKQRKDFTELLALERRASIFEPIAADSLENAEKLKSLMILNQTLALTEAKDDEIAQAVNEFVKGDDNARVHRRIYAASRLLQAKKNLPQVLELTQSAVAGVDSALNMPNAAAAVLADELFESRTLAMSRGEVIVVPNVPRQMLTNILRGRLEEITGWAFYQQEKMPEAVVRLKRAVSILPEKSAWWRSSIWKLGAALDATGKQTEALDSYIQSYTSGAPDAAKRSVIESLYQKINGNLDGLDKKIGAGQTNANSNFAAPKAVITQNSEVVKPAPNPIVATSPEVKPATISTPEIKSDTKEEPISGNNASPTAKPLFEPIIIAVPKPTTAAGKNSSETAEDSKIANDSCQLTLSQESVTITSEGGSLGVLAGFSSESSSGDIAKITATSSSPKDVEITLEPGIGAQSNRAFFVIKSISANKGDFNVVFDSPCGKKEILVKVR